MLGIYSSIWTICHKLMWFYQNAVLFHIIFVVTHGESLVTWVIRVPWQSTKWRCRRWIGGDGVILMLLLEKNTIALRVQRFAAGVNIICLTYATDWWAVIGPVIHDESKSQATRSSSVHEGLLHTLSTSDTQESKLRVGLVLEVLAKLMVGENSSWEFPKVGVRLILELRLILETRRYCEIALRWISLDLTIVKWTLVQVMTRCRQATSHYMSQYWPRSVSLWHHQATMS